MNTVLATILIIQPATLLIIGFLILGVVIWLFMPNKGGFALLAEMNKNKQRLLLEDALKFMFDCEYRKESCDINGIAGNLHITTDRASKLITRLTSMDLITVTKNGVVLTDTGRSYALRVIRVHRVWERYLADQTSVSPLNWHDEARKIQRTVSVEDTEKIAARIGNPVFDPHGDPIPTAEGDLPEAKGVGLDQMHEGQMVRIIHLEDEPKSIYEQLLVLGLYVGMKVYVTDVTDHKITFVAEGEECVLTRLFAGYITVEEIKDEQVSTSKHDLLSSLKIGEVAEVVGISPNCRGAQRRRLMDLGVIPGGTISAVMKSASGDPMGYRILGTTIGIRKQQAELVFINRKKDQHEYA